MDETYKPYTYMTVFSTGEFYIGSKYAKGISPETSTEYFGSPRGNTERCLRHKKLLSEETPRKIILAVWEDKDSTIEHEVLLHSIFFYNSLCLNGARQTCNKFSYDKTGKKYTESELESRRKQWTSLAKKRQSDFMVETYWTESRKNKARETQANRFKDPEYANRHSDRMKNSNPASRKEVRDKISTSALSAPRFTHPSHPGLYYKKSVWASNFARKTEDKDKFMSELKEIL